MKKSRRRGRGGGGEEEEEEGENLISGSAPVSRKFPNFGSPRCRLLFGPNDAWR